MYLDKIEIHGFKSFGDAVRLNIPKGITGVVGPNGSGKSNVADAIRWVLGEQSAKSLRGSKMEDIIFAGTEKRKSLGYAEVAMFIKNPDKEMPIDYGEVVIKRRVYRSGESEYFINGSTCRLRDVQELFMDTGVGKEGYSIIGQGQIDRVLSSKPDERRTLFEEAAGIYKYKVRRIEAEKKLEKERENLLRVHDILSEIEARLEPLEREAKKTKQFLQLKEQLKEIDINIFIYEIDRLEKEFLLVSENIDIVDTQTTDTIQEKEKVNVQHAHYKQQKSELFDNIEKLIEHISNLEKEQDKKHSQIEINKEKIGHAEKLLEQTQQDKKNQGIDDQNRLDKILLFQSKRTALEIEKASKLDIMKEEEQRLEEISILLGRIESTIGESREELYLKMREIDSLKVEMQKNEGVENQLEYRTTQIIEHIKSLNSAIQHQEVNIKVLEKDKESFEKQREHLRKDLLVTDTSKKTLENTKQVKQKDANILEQNVAQADRQLKWLQNIKSGHEGYFASVKQVLNLVDAEPVKWAGIVGVVGEVLEVPKHYETAIVTALGSAIQYIVTQTEDDAKSMITLMKKKGISRVTFLPQNTMSVGSFIKDRSIEGEQGFLGIASQLVSYNKNYENIISSLLGRILIIDTMENASRIAKKYQYKYKLVTLDGEVFNSGGSLSGGSAKNQSNNIFSRNREIKELEEKVLEYEAQFKVMCVELKQIEQSLEVTYKKWDEINDALMTLEDKQKNTSLALDKEVQSLKLTKNNQLQLIDEKNNIEDTLEKIKEDTDIVGKSLEQLEGTISSNQDAIKTLENELTAIRQEKDEVMQRVTNQKVGLSSIEHNIVHINEQLEELQVNIKEQEEKKLEVEERIENYIKDKETLLQVNEDIKKEIEVLETTILTEQIKRSDYNAKKIEYENLELELEGLNQNILENLERLREEKYRLDNKKQTLEMQKQNWGNTIWEQYELTYNHAVAYKKDLGAITELKKISSDIKFQIKQIGNVNVNAVEEFAETKSRYEFLTAQREDIKKAEATLLEMIGNLTGKMKEIFKEQFQIIATNFTSVFIELFGGGEAYLELTDPENVLESGIEIIAKPPGKKLQNMTLLSGGERTLTAISLLFGILKLKPSPFCVLDEIESALDDANVLRFADYLNKLSYETQFIVITHRKGTMERAHTLYGVTQQERGVSTILSIQLENAADYLDNKKTS